MKIISVPESVYSDALAQALDGRREIQTPIGRIDVLTDLEVIEVKHISGWKGAVGQVILYAIYYPQHGKRVHLIGIPTIRQKELIEIACNKVGVRVTWTEISQGENDEQAVIVEEEEDEISIDLPLGKKANFNFTEPSEKNKQIQQKVLSALRSSEYPLSVEDLFLSIKIQKSEKRSMRRAIERLVAKNLVIRVKGQTNETKGRPRFKFCFKTEQE